MRRFLRLPTGARFSLMAVAAYAALRAAASVGRPVGVFPDSVGYESLSFVGANDRFWPVPLAFRLADTQGGRVLLHVAIGTLAWAFLARTVALRSRWPRALTCAVLLVGLAPQVVRWDLAMLSESLGISFTVMAIAASVWVAREPSVASHLAWFVSVTLCGFTRPVHLVVIGVCLVGAATVAIATRGRRKAVASIVLVAVAAWGWSMFAGNRPTSELNLYTIVAARVITDDDRYAWFVDNGMPDIPGLRGAEGYDFSGELPPDLASYLDLPRGQVPLAIMRAGGMQLAEWIRNDGWSTYLRYLAAHPSQVWSRLTTLTPTVLDPPNDDYLPLSPRTVVPRVFFAGWWLWIVAGLTALAAGAARPGGARLGRAIAAMGGTAAMVHLVNLFASGTEHERHSVAVAVTVRVLALCAIGHALAQTRAEPPPARGRSVATDRTA